MSASKTSDQTLSGVKVVINPPHMDENTLYPYKPVPNVQQGMPIFVYKNKKQTLKGTDYLLGFCYFDGQGKGYNNSNKTPEENYKDFCKDVEFKGFAFTALDASGMVTATLGGVVEVRIPATQLSRHHFGTGTTIKYDVPRPGEVDEHHFHAPIMRPVDTTTIQRFIESSAQDHLHLERHDATNTLSSLLGLGARLVISRLLEANVLATGTMQGDLAVKAGVEGQPNGWVVGGNADVADTRLRMLAVDDLLGKAFSGDASSPIRELTALIEQTLVSGGTNRNFRVGSVVDLPDMLVPGAIQRAAANRAGNLFQAQADLSEHAAVFVEEVERAMHYDGRLVQNPDSKGFVPVDHHAH